MNVFWHVCVRLLVYGNVMYRDDYACLLFVLFVCLFVCLLVGWFRVVVDLFNGRSVTIEHPMIVPPIVDLAWPREELDGNPNWKVLNMPLPPWMSIEDILFETNVPTAAAAAADDADHLHLHGNDG